MKNDAQWKISILLSTVSVCFAIYQALKQLPDSVVMRVLVVGVVVILIILIIGSSTPRVDHR
jgi:hypothetical protein